MRVRDHVVLSTAAAALLYPRLRRSVIAAWAPSIFIDVDHYLWFAATHRRLDPVSAVRSFTSASAPQDSETRLLHHPALLLGLAAASSRVRALRLPAVGMAFHVALDAYHRGRTRRVYAAALARDMWRCQVCGSDEAVVVHVWRQPLLLPSYRLDNFVTLCEPCHELAHAGHGRAVAHLSCDWDAYLRSTRLLERAAAAGGKSITPAGAETARR